MGFWKVFGIILVVLAVVAALITITVGIGFAACALVGINAWDTAGAIIYFTTMICWLAFLGAITYKCISKWGVAL